MRNLFPPPQSKVRSLSHPGAPHPASPLTLIPPAAATPVVQCCSSARPAPPWTPAAAADASGPTPSCAEQAHSVPSCGATALACWAGQGRTGQDRAGQGRTGQEHALQRCRTGLPGLATKRHCSCSVCTGLGPTGSQKLSEGKVVVARGLTDGVVLGRCVILYVPAYGASRQ